MSSLNKVILIGNLGGDPEASNLRNGDAVTNLRLATSSRWKDRESGETVEHTEWHQVVLFRRSAEIAAQYLKKGDSCLIEGRLKTRKWADKNGVDHYSTEIVGDRLTILGKRTKVEQSTEDTELPATEAIGG